MSGVAKEFLNLPVEEKMKLYSSDPSKTTRLSTSSNLQKEKIQNWGNDLRLHCQPLDKCVHEWPTNPETQLVSSGFPYSTIPPSYGRPEPDRPKLSEVADLPNAPVIDLGYGDNKLIVQQISEACQHYGFFQVINHGVSRETMDKMFGVAKEFFNLPVEEKMKLYSNDPSKTTRLSTSSNLQKEKIQNWRDDLRLHCQPLDEDVQEWPTNPTFFNSTMEVQKQSSPEWLEAWLQLPFYSEKCKNHVKQYNTVYCGVCMGQPVCEICWKHKSKEHKDHDPILHVRIASWRAAMDMEDISKFFDISHIQPYRINRRDIVFLNYHKKGKPNPNRNPNCEICRRRLISSDYRFCSIDCKSMHIEEKNCDHPGEKQQPPLMKKKAMMSTTEWCSTLRKRGRKGIPHRAPLK